MTNWLLVFDLDDTLYPFESGIFEFVRERIQEWLMHTLRISHEEAERLRQHYYHTYGTTLAGVRAEHPELDTAEYIEDYLAFVHAVPIERYVQPDAALDAMLSRLDAPKAIFTNAIRDWAERVTDALGVRHHFSTIVDVCATQYVSKPAPYAYTVLLETLQVPPQRCVMLDDQARNLRPAAQMGMRTVLVNATAPATDEFDYVAPTIYATESWLQQVLRDGEA